MELPPPPPPFAQPATAEPWRPIPAPPPTRRAGQLTDHWTAVFSIGWLLVAASFVAVWYSSRLIGLSTWWLGPSTEPQVIFVSLLPVIVPLALSVAGMARVRYLPWWGLAGAAFVAVVAAFDINRVPGYAAIEFGLAIGGLLISLAAFAGVYRAAAS